jgi:hypothetical protein
MRTFESILFCIGMEPARVALRLKSGEARNTSDLLQIALRSRRDFNL